MQSCNASSKGLTEVQEGDRLAAKHEMPETGKDVQKAGNARDKDVQKVLSD